MVSKLVECPPWNSRSLLESDDMGYISLVMNNPWSVDKPAPVIPLFISSGIQSHSWYYKRTMDNDAAESQLPDNDRNFLSRRSVKDSPVHKLVFTGEDCHTRGDFESAIKLYDSLLNVESLPPHLAAKIIFNLSLCYSALGREYEAARTMERISYIPESRKHPGPKKRPLTIHSSPVDLVRQASKSDKLGNSENARKYLEILNVSRGFRSDESLSTWLHDYYCQ